MTSTDDRTEFERKAAEAQASPGYIRALEREHQEQAAAERRRREARLRDLARVAVQALKGELGERAQTDVTVALTKAGDLRPDVEALARWDVDVRAQRKPTPLEVPIIKSALENRLVEYQLRAVQALLSEAARDKKDR